MKIATFVKIGDDIIDILREWEHVVTECHSENDLIAVEPDTQLFVIRAGQDAWRLRHLATIRASFSDAKILVTSAINWAEFSEVLGATAFFHIGRQSIEELKEIIDSLS